MSAEEKSKTTEEDPRTAEFKKLVEKSGHSQAKIAEMLKVGESHISSILHNKSRPSYLLLELLQIKVTGGAQFHPTDAKLNGVLKRILELQPVPRRKTLRFFIHLLDVCILYK